MLRLSVIICTHNPRPEYLRRTLESLQAQTLPDEQWELLIIDNKSSQPVADELDLSWAAQARCVREEEVGLTPARLRGITEARGELLVFVDDDNVLAPDYLSEALAVQESCNFLAAFGAGVLTPEFEKPPRPETAHVLHMLALRTVDTLLWSNNPRDAQAIPWGAGLCVTRALAQNYIRLVAKLRTAAVLDRRGENLFCGGDDLFSWAASAMEAGFGIFPQLRITHLISAPRLEPAYLLRLIRAHSFSHGVLRYLLTGAEPARSDIFHLVKLPLHGLRNGVFSMQCQREEARGADDARRFIASERLQPLPGTGRSAATQPRNDLSLVGAD